jgi:hypothetical protein
MKGGELETGTLPHQGASSERLTAQNQRTSRWVRSFTLKMRIIFRSLWSTVFVSLLPVSAVEGAVLDGFGDVARLDLLDSFKISHGPGHTQYPIVSSR